MNLGRIKYWAGRQWHNIPGWRTRRKIVVFESDDWGSIRMPSREVYDLMHNKGYPVESLASEKFDSIETTRDLQLLFDVLTRVKDKNANPALFTANFIMTNPDFIKIRECNFSRYFGEDFIKTYEKSSGSEGVFRIIQKGISEGLFHPQYHGYSHFNYAEWMNALQTNEKDAHIYFNFGMVGAMPPHSLPKSNPLVASLRFNNNEQFQEQRIKAIEGSRIFENIFGFKSKSFIAPVYTWNSAIEAALASEGIKYIQGGRFQIEPILPDGRILRRKHFLGEKNQSGQIYLVRNVFFEPATDKYRDWIDSTLTAIKAGFFWRKPAIISTHRLNYMGKIHPENRQKSLSMLEELLKTITSKWPDVEFMTTDQLGALIAEDYNTNAVYSIS